MAQALPQRLPRHQRNARRFRHGPAGRLPSDPGGGGSFTGTLPGGGTGGDDEDPCAPGGNGGIPIGCSGGTGGDGDNSADDYPPATPDAVMDHIRDVCANAPGVTLPADDSGLSPYFQASVRKSANASVSQNRRFQWDGDDQNHSQLTSPVDGYAEGASYADGTPIPNLVTAIMEVKFGPDPSNLMSSNQYETHIDDLARAYNRAPGGDFDLGTPQYVLVSNSQFSSIDNLGSDYSVRLPAYAASKGVNVMHIRVTKDAGGQFYLEGDLIGSPVDALNWIKDVFVDEKIPFEVSCHRED